MGLMPVTFRLRIATDRKSISPDPARVPLKRPHTHRNVAQGSALIDHHSGLATKFHVLGYLKTCLECRAPDGGYDFLGA
jgi:hypothetical protein